MVQNISISSYSVKSNSSISNNSVLYKYSFYPHTVKMSKQFYFKKFIFSIVTQFSSVWPIDRAQSGATTPGKSVPESDGNEWVLLCFLYLVGQRTLLAPPRMNQPLISGK